jgi:hypothetical protein
LLAMWAYPQSFFADLLPYIQLLMALFTDIRIGWHCNLPFKMLSNVVN